MIVAEYVTTERFHAADVARKFRSCCFLSGWYIRRTVAARAGGKRGFKKFLVQELHRCRFRVQPQIGRRKFVAGCYTSETCFCDGCLVIALYMLCRARTRSAPTLSLGCVQGKGICTATVCVWGVYTLDTTVFKKVLHRFWLMLSHKCLRYKFLLCPFNRSKNLS